MCPLEVGAIVCLSGTFYPPSSKYCLEQGFPPFPPLGQHALVMPTYFEHWGKWLRLSVAVDDHPEGPAAYPGPHATPEGVGRGLCLYTPTSRSQRPSSQTRPLHWATPCPEAGGLPTCTA